jgi:hypothetical protein
LTTTTRRPRPPLTPLNPETVQRRPAFLAGYESDGEGGQRRRTTGDQVWGAESADGCWTYTRVDGIAGTPWDVEYLPTGQVTQHASLPKARLWTAHQGGAFALANLRAGALTVVERGGASGAMLCFTPGTPASVRAAARKREAEAAAVRLGLARRALAVLDGLLIGDAPTGRCTGRPDCGGYLAEVVAGGRAEWVHVDACRECSRQPIEKRRGCELAHQHVPCDDPDPVLCEHYRCAAPAVRGQCPRGRDACCGCCEHDE